MIDRRHLETVLRINGVEVTSPDEQIRSVLLSARFNEDEVETALTILRENVDTKELRVDGLHKVFRTDESLKSSEVNYLLGIDVSFDQKISVPEATKKAHVAEFVVLCLVSLVIAAAAIVFYMYSHQMGLFHASNNLVFLQ